MLYVVCCMLYVVLNPLSLYDILNTPIKPTISILNTPIKPAISMLYAVYETHQNPPIGGDALRQ
jgi:hypothetical protein